MRCGIHIRMYVHAHIHTYPCVYSQHYTSFFHMSLLAHTSTAIVSHYHFKFLYLLKGIKTENSFKNIIGGASGWFSQLSISLLILAQVMIPGSWDWAPHRAPHCVWSLLEILPLSCSLSLSLSFSLPQSLSPTHTLSKLIIIIIIIIKFHWIHTSQLFDHAYKNANPRTGHKITSINF